MAAKRKDTVLKVYSDEELQKVAREVVARASGLSSSEFKRELGPDHKALDKRVLAIATQLAARREVYRWSNAKKQRFFRVDPFDALAGAVAQILETGPIAEMELKRRLESIHRGFGDLLKEWLKGAVQRGSVFIHPPTRGSSAKRYAATPNIGVLLKKVLTELKKAMATSIGQLVPKEQVLEFIASDLGLAQLDQRKTTCAAKPRFLEELTSLSTERGSQSLVSVRELRARLPFDKATFDQCALELAQAGTVTVHQHDFPTSLSDADRAELVADARGNYYVGIALMVTQ